MNIILLTLILLLLSIFALSQFLILVGTLTQNTLLEYYGRATASFLALFLCACYGTLFSALLSIIGYGGLGQWTTARSFKWIMWLFTSVWFDVQDPHDWLGKTRPMVLLGNHQTELDVLMLGHVFPRYCSVTSKKSLKWVPFLGWFMALSKTVFIERKSRSQAFAAFDAAAEQMHTLKQSVYIFPEGTRSYYELPDLLSFKKGAFHLAIQAQVPIVAVVSANYSNILNMKRKIFRAGTIPARVLEPISTKGKGKEDVDALMEEVRGKMLAALQDLHGIAREKGIATQKPEKIGGANGAIGKSSGVALAEGGAS